LSFWTELLLSLPQSIVRTLAELRRRRLIFLAPVVIIRLLTAMLFLVIGTVQPLAPFIYSLI
jgi:hypothetical protein